jgi:hypothetical protein
MVATAESIEVKKRREREPQEERNRGIESLPKSQEREERPELPSEPSQRIKPEEKELQEQRPPEELSWVQDIQIAFAQPLRLDHKNLDEKLPSAAYTISPYCHISIPSSISLQPYDIIAKKVDSEIKGIITTIAKIYGALREIPSIGFKEPKELISITPDTNLVPPSTKGSFTDLVRFIPGLSVVTFRKVPEISVPLKLDSSVLVRKMAIIEKLKGVPEPEEVATILDRIFDIDEETRRGLTHILYDRPRLIIAYEPPGADLSYVELLKRLLREIYRVCAGGLPKPRHMSKDLSEVELDITADRSVYVLTSDSMQGREKALGDRLRELYSQRYGFLVLYGMEKKLNTKFGEEPYPLPITLRLGERSKDHLMKVVKAFYGFV